jgi:glycerol uptake facilitator-like aquaporin
VSARLGAEFLGAFWLVFGRCGSAVLAPSSPARVTWMMWRQVCPHRSVVSARKVNDTGIDYTWSTHQHMVELDERTDQSPALGQVGAQP